MFRFRVYAPDADATVSAGGSTDTTTPEAPAAPAATEAAAPEPWDGSWEKVEKRPWWSGVPDEDRKHLQGAYDRRKYLDDLFAQDDATAALTTEVSTLKSSLTAKDTEVGEWRSKAEGYERELTDVRADARLKEIEAKFPDIFGDFTFDEKTGEPTGGALTKFGKLVSNGFSDEEAAAMVRATMPKTEEPPAPPPKTRDVIPPKSVAAMEDGKLNAAATERVRPGSLDEALREAMRKAQAEDAASDA